jgi:hypothetical protein
MKPTDDTIALIMTVCTLLGKDTNPPDVVRAYAASVKNIRFWQGKEDFGEIFAKIANE